MIGLETILAAESKLWTTLDGLHALRKDTLQALKDWKVNLEKMTALYKIHLQNLNEIRRAPVSSFDEFKSLKQGAGRIERNIKEGLVKAREATAEVKRLDKEIAMNQRKLEALEAKAQLLKEPARVLELKHEDEGSPKTT